MFVFSPVRFGGCIFFFFFNRLFFRAVLRPQKNQDKVQNFPCTPSPHMHSLQCNLILQELKKNYTLMSPDDTLFSFALNLRVASMAAGDHGLTSAPNSLIQWGRMWVPWLLFSKERNGFYGLWGNQTCTDPPVLSTTVWNLVYPLDSNPSVMRNSLPHKQLLHFKMFPLLESSSVGGHISTEWLNKECLSGLLCANSTKI